MTGAAAPLAVSSSGMPQCVSPPCAGGVFQALADDCKAPREVPPCAGGVIQALADDCKAPREVPPCAGGVIQVPEDACQVPRDGPSRAGLLDKPSCSLSAMSDPILLSPELRMVLISMCRR